MIGKPYSGKPNVRFDEGELEIEPLATTPALYSTGTFKKEINVQLLKDKGGVERRRSATCEPVKTKVEVIFCENVGMETDSSRSSRLFPRNQDIFIFCRS
jgi:hypothetical protein